MIDKVKARMNELADEAENLYKRKIEIEEERERIEVRMAQVVGAMQELDSLLREQKVEG